MLRTVVPIVHTYLGPEAASLVITTAGSTHAISPPTQQQLANQQQQISAQHMSLLAVGVA
jgi:hypothetical protein